MSKIFTTEQTANSKLTITVQATRLKKNFNRKSFFVQVFLYSIVSTVGMDEN